MESFNEDKCQTVFNILTCIKLSSLNTYTLQKINYLMFKYMAECVCFLIIILKNVSGELCFLYIPEFLKSESEWWVYSSGRGFPKNL